MTDKATSIDTWKRGAYVQPRVINPPSLQNASEARKGIWHFGRELELLVFTPQNHAWRAGDASVVDDGRHERGIPLSLKIRGTWQPNTQKRGRGVIDAPGGGRTENNFIIHVDSHDPFNLDSIQATPGAGLIFPNGLRLFDFDGFGLEEGINFPMAIVFRGTKWKIKQPIPLWAGGDEDSSFQGAIYRAETQSWVDRHGERDGRGPSPSWGPRS